ncbi:GNAT family N-acetyltransferase [Parvularcula marina]|uniref:GNAT family N-acetyltransferase n=1 Tax=Parvularcula marina TaxID=2292771 RepID=A0A371RF72_9PROT|nr:GNAT family N-acetyltransferase [Parvularcula marina]RFB04099.1 GNAT family N-acetyltransferase [Parvularcula marina]
MSAKQITRSAPERHKVTITYLEQTRPPQPHAVARPAANVAILRCETPPVDFYRHLYNAVGEPHKWVSRRYLEDDILKTLIHAETVRIYVLYTDGWPAGFAEIDLAKPETPVIRFYGIVPEAQRQGLGRWFFHEILGLIWAEGPKSVRIDTCSMDSPSALRLYQRAGFDVIGQEAGLIEWYG